MADGKQRVLAQLVLGKAEQERYAARQVLDRLRAGADLAGVDAMLFWPSRRPELDGMVRDEARRLGMELYLWLPVLADAGRDPDPSEQTVDAWGTTGHGVSGAWQGLGKGDETFLFACPLAPDQLSRAEARMRDELPDYDGVFLDRIRYPSPANGLESIFTCFCPRCLERYPEAAKWREFAHELREKIASAVDADLRRWGDWNGLIRSFGHDPMITGCAVIIEEMVSRFSARARGMGKKVGLDLFSPSIAWLVGQNYSLLGEHADWIKPMSYCHAKGPAGLPLELACLARGLLAWSQHLSKDEIMYFMGRTFPNAGLPSTAAELEKKGLSEKAAGKELSLAAKQTTATLYPGFECVNHPDFDLEMTEKGVRAYLDAYAAAPGVVLSWNILYTPNSFLRVVGEACGKRS